MSEGKERIAKVLARAGLCSRREAERWIADGRVKVNGTKLDTPAVTVDDADIILVDGKPLPEKQQTRVWRYHKPVGMVTTHKDPEGRDTVFERVGKELGHVISVGRLDYNTEGLLLLTNDGELARKLELPATGWVRRYRVRVNGTVDEGKLASLNRGVTIEGVTYLPINATLDSTKGYNSWLTIALTEGKNREIRKVMDHLGLMVTRLIRLAYGPFQLGKLVRNQIEEVHPKALREQLGTTKKGAAKKGAAVPKRRDANANRRRRS